MNTTYIVTLQLLFLAVVLISVFYSVVKDFTKNIIMIYIMSFIGFPYSKSASLPGYGRNGLHQVGVHLNTFFM